MTSRWRGDWESNRITWLNEDQFTGVCVGSSEPGAVGWGGGIATRVK